VRDPWGERWRKWRRRRPYALVVGALFALAGAGVLGAGVAGSQYLGDRVRRGEAALPVGRQQVRQEHYADAERTLKDGLDAVGDLPGCQDLAGELAAELRQARRARLAHDLHETAEQVRFRYDGSTLAAGDCATLLADSRALWDRREQVLDRGPADLGEAVEARVRADLLDLALFWTDLRARSAEDGPDRAGALREVRRVLAEAEAAFGPSPGLLRQRQACAARLGDTATAAAAARQAAGMTPRTPWEHYTLGRSLLAAGEPDRAAGELEEALAEEPQGFWPRFDLGVCLYRQRKYHDAAAAFRTCTALAPASAECFFNLALAEQKDGRAGAARRDFDRARQLNPALPEAAERSTDY
jgi:tetratricopeptide (TPR) repeat protein